MRRRIGGRSGGRTAWLAAGLVALASAGAAGPVRAQVSDDTATPAPESNAVAVAIRDEVSSKLRGFYASRGFWPLWVRDDALGPEVDHFLDLLTSADLDGLDPRDYDAAELSRMVEDAREYPSPRTLARADMKLSSAFAAYVRDIRMPRINITWLNRELIPQKQRPDEILRQTALKPSFPEYIETMGWMDPAYARLRAALTSFERDWGQLPDVFIPPGPDFKPGAKGARVAALRQRLGLPDGNVYDKATAARVRAWQAAHGVPATGLAGKLTLGALARSEGDYARTVRLNLERARLLPSPWVRHVVVDAASARLWYYGDGKAQGSMKVVVGMPGSQTPMMAGLVTYAILNPYWNVPPDLVRKLIVPKIRAGATLAKMGYEALSDWTADARVLAPEEIDWDAVADGTVELRVRQLPGPANSMGKMKFMFPNDLGIYLHDTPDRKLFLKTVRQFSNGCIRLEDAPRLGKWFFDKPLVAESSDPEQQVALPEPVPVYLTYLTASPTDQGIAFFDDNYERDTGRAQGYASR